ncbi:MAG: hypothetical protein HZA53_06875, partial [Planctomycetes bacterium]|nr:hypothetical protein [Planctomycetota bacterium]
TRVVRAPRAAAIAVLALAFAGCASFQSERHLAPLFSELSTAGGGREIEALGGAVRLRYLRAEGGPLTQWAFRPIVIHDRLPGEDYQTRFLVPFGTEDKRGQEYVWQLLPVTRYSHREYSGGQTEWTLLTLPGIYWSKTVDGRIVRAWFPFGGVMEHFLSFDRIVFVFFPLFMKTERDGRVTHHFLFPVFAFARGKGGPSWRVWPIYGNSRFEGRYDRWFLFWPIWTCEHNLLDQPPEKQEHRWMLLPIVGHTTRGTYSGTSLLWPFFGWSSDPVTGFRAWDGPWPFIRWERDPENDIQRTRFWPFFSHFHGDGLDSTWYLWPIFNVRSETYEKATKNAFYAAPFWQNWKRYDEEAGYSSFEKLWPLYLFDRPEEHTTRFAFPTLNPLWRTPEIDDMYAWMWELYAREVNHAQVKERSWLGLYRREKDEFEDRRSLVGLWSNRRYRAGGKRVSETALLFGLLRWRSTRGGSLEWLPPAVPGPGWPLERASESH